MIKERNDLVVDLSIFRMGECLSWEKWNKEVGISPNEFFVRHLDFVVVSSYWKLRSYWIPTIMEGGSNVSICELIGFRVGDTPDLCFPFIVPSKVIADLRFLLEWWSDTQRYESLGLGVSQSDFLNKYIYDYTFMVEEYLPKLNENKDKVGGWEYYPQLGLQYLITNLRYDKEVGIYSTRGITPNYLNIFRNNLYVILCGLLYEGYTNIVYLILSYDYLNYVKTQSGLFDIRDIYQRLGVYPQLQTPFGFVINDIDLSIIQNEANIRLSYKGYINVLTNTLFDKVGRFNPLITSKIPNNKIASSFKYTHPLNHFDIITNGFYSQIQLKGLTSNNFLANLFTFKLSAFLSVLN